MVVPLQSVLPAIISVAYYLFVFFFAEVSRKLVDLSLKKSSLVHLFLVELIATAQMCTCVYENAIIIKHYGPSGFFLVVTFLQIAGAFFNRGAFVSPLAPIELFLRGKMDTEKFLAILLSQTLGGYSAFRLANSLWYYSQSYSTDHHQFYDSLPCALSYKVPFYYALLFELFGSFLLRFLLHRFPLSSRHFFAPPTIAAFLSFALTFIGVPGLNPVVTSSRLQGCPGLDLQWFIMTYWCCPVVGWLLASKLDKTPTKQKKKVTKEKTKQKKS
ncbi:hypothetical protein niasHT_028009 [Heterodera trifolii]|uniref:Aquaporin n=1 Tax=Heterodera trifolii TaxID=157864 RepID=A0ABD2KE79_9BILA